MKTAVAYYRTSSAANVGADKDSLARQQQAVQSYASANGIEVVKEYYDAAVSGADALSAREGFSDMMSYMLSNGARIILVENASRFSRDLIVQETGYQMLKAKGISLVPVDAPESFMDNANPTAVFIRQVLGAVHQLDKTMLVDKLRGARDRKSAKLGYRIEGNPAFGKIPVSHVEAAQAANDGKSSLLAISAVLASQGFLSKTNKPYTAASINKMLKRNS